MILCLPFHPSSPVDYDKFAGHLKRKGSMPNHTLLVVTLQQHEEQAFSFAMGLAGMFHRHFLSVVPDDRGTTLKHSNRMFLAACKALHEYAPDRKEIADPAMLYYDPSWRPVKNRWLDELQAEYYFQNAPVVFGNLVDGSPVEGPVILAKSYPAKSRLLDFLPDNEHWRKYLASEMVNLGVKTDAIGSQEAAYIRPYAPEK